MSFVKTTLRISGLLGRLLPGVAAAAFLLVAVIGTLKLSKQKPQ